MTRWLLRALVVLVVAGVGLYFFRVHLGNGKMVVEERPTHERQQIQRRVEALGDQAGAVGAKLRGAVADDDTAAAPTPAPPATPAPKATPPPAADAVGAADRAALEALLDEEAP